jgi:hypothetical protein
VTKRTAVSGCRLRRGLLDFAVLDAVCANADALSHSVDHGVHGLKVDVPAPVGQIMGVANPMSELWTAAADIADSRHESEFPSLMWEIQS